MTKYENQNTNIPPILILKHPKLFNDTHAHRHTHLCSAPQADCANGGLVHWTDKAVTPTPTLLLSFSNTE